MWAKRWAGHVQGYGKDTGGGQMWVMWAGCRWGRREWEVSEDAGMQVRTLGKMWVWARRWAGHKSGKGQWEVSKDAGMQVGRMLGKMLGWACRWAGCWGRCWHGKGGGQDVIMGE